MKNKIAKILVAVCAIIPCLFMATACDDGKKEEATVNPYEGKTYWEVSTYTDFVDKINILKGSDDSLKKDIIKLTADIAGNETTANTKIWLQQIPEVTIDLNGYGINDYLRISNSSATTPSGVTKENSNFKMTVNIVDYSSAKTGFIGTEDEWYGCDIIGNGENENKEFTVNFSDIEFRGQYGGFTTSGNNGNVAVNITATNCKFKANNTEDADDCVAFAALSNYNFALTNCQFEGASAFYAKSGNIILKNCTLKAKGNDNGIVYYGNGVNSSGAALSVDSATGYVQNLKITIDGGTFTSINGYSILEKATAASGKTKTTYAQVKFINEPTYNYGTGKLAKQFETASVVVTEFSNN